MHQTFALRIYYVQGGYVNEMLAEYANAVGGRRETFPPPPRNGLARRKFRRGHLRLWFILLAEKSIVVDTHEIAMNLSTIERRHRKT